MKCPSPADHPSGSSTEYVGKTPPPRTLPIVRSVVGDATVGEVAADRVGVRAWLGETAGAGIDAEADVDACWSVAPEQAAATDRMPIVANQRAVRRLGVWVVMVELRRSGSRPGPSID
jgi:hypothetical protein